MANRAANRGHSVLRMDVEGLRAVAVLLVIGDHLFARPRGGFIGVDVFFVVSGFLITGLLVREVERTGTVSFRGFYARRVRRIAPAAFLTLIVTYMAARLIYVGTRAHETLVDAIWASASLANWHFAAIGTDYFQQGRPPSAIQHYWSLSVEEQFYFVWPLLIIAVAIMTRGRRHGRRPLACVLAVLVVASFIWSIYQSTSDATGAYFSTMARAWELGVGSLVALIAHRLTRLPRIAGAMLSWAGLGAIAVSAVIIHPTSAFPAPWGALPVMGTAAVLVGGMSPDHAPRMILLTNPVSRYIGRISYSLYLWHWPVITLLGVLMPTGTLRYVVWTLGVTAAVAVVSYHGVEAPVRRSHWLSPRPTAIRTRSRTRTLQLAGSLCLAVAAAAVAGTALHSPPSATAVGKISTSVLTTSAKSQSGLSMQIQKALDTESWPKLSPSVDQLDDAKAAEWKPCGNVNASNKSKCVFGSKSASKTHQILVLGDSIGISWLPGIRAALEPDGWRITGMTFGQCPAVRIDVTVPKQDSAFTKRCAAHQVWELREAVAQRPAVIIMAAATNTLTRMPCCTNVGAAAAAWQRAEQAAVNQLKASRAKIIILSPPPETKSVAACATRFNSPSACVTQIRDTWYQMSNADRKVATATDAKYVDTHKWFCTSDGVCPPFISHTIVSADGTHLTRQYSKMLGPLLRTAITGT